MTIYHCFTVVFAKRCVVTCTVLNGPVTRQPVQRTARDRIERPNTVDSQLVPEANLALVLTLTLTQPWP